MARPQPTRSGQHNLPAPSTALVGRDQDVARVCQLVLHRERRLVTLTGVGGCGKTRLALSVAFELVGSFKDGIWLAQLASIADPLLVPQVVASVLGVRERPGRSLQDGLVAHLRQRQLLLVLDNCEHLVGAVAELADTLLQGCPNQRLLATSRAPLHIGGEVAYRVAPLAFPDLRASLSAKELGAFPAVQLFVERAAAVNPSFVLTARSSQVVAAICARLEGLPLAIELAAAWVRALSVDEILERLDNVFGLLVGGSRTAPSRQQTMRATLDWSYGLLTPHEQVVFQRVAVFLGGWSLAAAEVVCSGNGPTPQEVLALLTRLLDASLVQVEEQDMRTRYRLSEPVRQYAHEQLVASGELDSVRRQHATFFLAFAEGRERDANVGGPGRPTAHAALEQEQNNLRAALRWCLGEGEAQMGLRLGRAHWSVWVVRGHFTEGRDWLSQLVALPDAEKTPALRAVAQTIEAGLTWRQGSYAAAQQLYAEALPPLQQAGDPWLLANLFMGLAFIALYQGEYLAAQTHFEEALVAWRAAGDQVNEAVCLSNLGRTALAQKSYSQACRWLNESLALSRAAGDTWAVSIALNILSYVMLGQGDLVTARRLVEECLVLRRQIGERWGLAFSLDALGRVAVAEGHHPEAQSALRESLRLRQELGDRSGMADSLESIAALAAAVAQPHRAVHLAGAAASVREIIGAPLDPNGRGMLDDWLVPLRRVTGEEATKLAWEAGRATPFNQAVQLALATTDAPRPRSKRESDRSRHAAVLSPREQEVASLLAHGMSNRQIAGQLVVAERTVASHIEHILSKLGFASRHQVGAWAAEHGLLH